MVPYIARVARDLAAECVRRVYKDLKTMPAMNATSRNDQKRCRVAYLEKGDFNEAQHHVKQ